MQPLSVLSVHVFIMSWVMMLTVLERRLEEKSRAVAAAMKSQGTKDAAMKKNKRAAKKDAVMKKIEVLPRKKPQWQVQLAALQ